MSLTVRRSSQRNGAGNLARYQAPRRAGEIAARGVHGAACRPT